MENSLAIHDRLMNDSPMPNAQQRALADRRCGHRRSGERSGAAE